MIAAIAKGGKMKNIPQIRLAMALPLIAGGIVGAAAPPANGPPAAASVTRPHTRQNLSSAVTLLPHPAQNEAIYPSRHAQSEMSLVRGAQKFARNILFVCLAVNVQVKVWICRPTPVLIWSPQWIRLPSP
jgi:hypothetical protein